ncbi:hypothetical protein CIRG_05462 [Coccidioides immitis RMSCC 2394]|uniref:C3H1-type domain-containing protein n=1 Tax=Coccidioides immitis RMSCC 2394 TaxID=404692 RepID=A0A0J6YAQ3_COCIT|nr:hypothetical protein CIRG_05462 [Coccidioides immitis RMSCC 2394]
MDQAMLEKTKNDKILSRFVKKGGETIKKLAQAVLENAALATKNKSESAKAATKENTTQVKKELSEVPYPHALNRNPGQPNAKKRAREPEGSNGPAPKRVVSPPIAKTVSRPLAASATTTQRGIASGSDNKPASQNATQPIKPKANIVTPKPTPSLFSSLMSASKKPGTSNAARAAAAAAAAKEKAKTEQETPRPPPRPAFSFAETLADLSKPKEITSAKPVEELPPETEEEKAKRLRKEERRKLRVSWKPDDSLVEVRLFTHDPEEEIGRDDSAKRDVSDLAGEGRTLKMHRGLDDLDEDDDDDDMLAYRCPSEIDFTDLEASDRERNFVKTGGEKAPKSPAKEDQDQREVNTLSVFYTSPEDVPVSPKEPPTPEKDEEAYEPEDDFGQPSDQVKARSAKYFAAMAAMAAKATGARTPGAGVAPQSAPPVPAAPPAPQVQPSAQMDISSLLKVLQHNQLPPVQPQQQQPAPQSNMSDLERIFNQFRETNQAPVQQQQQQPPAAPVATQGLDWQKLLNVMALQKQMQPAPTFPQVQATQGPDLAAILAQLNPGTQQGQQKQQQQMAQSFDFSQQVATPYENPERKRYREAAETEDADDNGYGYNKRSRANGDSGKSKKHPKAGLVPCRYWKEGKCLKGSDCTFRHDPLD